jgi:hypothetical protein
VPVLEKRRGDLSADRSRLAHAGHDDAARALEEQLHGALEVAVRCDRPGRGSRPPRSEDLARELEADSVSRHTAPLRDRVDADEPLQERLEQDEPQRVLRVALRLLRPLVDFHEHAVDAAATPPRPSAR